MPLRAITEDRKDIFCWDFTSSRELLKQYPKGTLFCPLCNDELGVRAGTAKRRLHFWHQYGECGCPYENEEGEGGGGRESWQHISGKFRLLELMKASYQEPDAYFTVEYPMAIGQHGRIADVAGVLSDGYTIVYECQLAKISIETLERRTSDYVHAGAEVMWWLGGSANTAENREYLLEALGQIGVLTFRDTVETTIIDSSPIENITR